MYNSSIIEEDYLIRNFKAFIVSTLFHIIVLLSIFIIFKEPIKNAVPEMKIKLYTSQPRIVRQFDKENKSIQEYSKSNIKTELKSEPEINVPKLAKSPDVGIKFQSEKNVPKFKKEVKSKNIKKRNELAATKNLRKITDQKQQQKNQIIKQELLTSAKTKNLTGIIKPDLSYDIEKPTDVISDKEEIIGAELISKNIGSAINKSEYNIESASVKEKPNYGNSLIYDTKIEDGLQVDKNISYKFNKLEPMNLGNLKYEKSSVETTNEASRKARRILRKPDMPAPRWLEQKGLCTYIILDGIVNEAGQLEKVEIAQMSPYYKLDILAKDFVMKNWLWEKGDFKQPVRIKLAVYLKK